MLLAFIAAEVIPTYYGKNMGKGNGKGKVMIRVRVRVRVRVLVGLRARLKP